MADPTLESMLAGSTPRQFALAGGLPLALAAGGLLGAAGHAAPGGGPASRASSAVSAYSAAAPPMLTFPTAPGELSAGADEGGACCRCMHA